MGINTNDLPAKFNPDYLKTQPYDMEFLTHMADKAEKNALDAQDSLDKLSGLAGSLNPAPGNEEWAKKVGTKYTKELDDIATNFNKMSYAEIRSKANKVKSNFLNDPNVKTIVNNREYYEKTLSPYLSKSESKFNINKIPYLDRENKFQQNEMNYDGTLNYTPFADYDKHIDDYLKDVEYRIAKKSGYSITPDKNTGLLMLNTSKGAIKVRELPEFQASIDALTKSMVNPNRPESAYFKDSVERDYPGAYNEDFLKRHITQRAQRFFNTQDLSETDHNIIPGQFDKDKNPEDSKPLPTLELNQDGSNIPAKEKTLGMNPSGNNLFGIKWGTDNSISIPYLGSSTEKIQQPLGVDGRYNLGNKKYYVIGDGSSESSSEYGSAGKAPLTLYNTRVTGHVVGYKIINSPDKDKIGNIVTAGKYGSIGATSNNAKPSYEEESGKYIMFNDQNQRIEVQPVALRTLKGSETPDGEDSENITLEEIPRRESLKYFGGEDFSNEPYIEIKENGIHSNIDQKTATRLLMPYTNNPEMVKIMNAYKEIQLKDNLSTEDLKVIHSLNELLKQAEYEEAKKEIISPKSEYTPKGPLGTEQ